MEGYNRYGYAKDRYNRHGYDRYGCDRYGYDSEGYDRAGYDREGYNKKGYDRKGNYRETGTRYDEEGYDKAGYDRDGYDRYGYDKKGYDREGYNREGFDQNGIDRKGINKCTGEKDDRIQFAEEFIESKLSIERFAKSKGMPIEYVKAKIEKIRTSPCIKESIDKALTGNANRFKGAMIGERDKLLSGEMTIREVRGINNVLGFCTVEESQRIIEMLIKAMASHDITVLEYKSILGIKEHDRSLPRKIIEQINIMNTEARKSQSKDIRLLVKEMQKEVTRIKAYQAPYVANAGEKLGYLENPNDKQPKMVSVTDEHRDAARQYLIATDEFICEKTMRPTLMQIIRGTLDREKIERAKLEKQLRSLQEEDKQLDELTDIAKQVMQEKQPIAHVSETSPSTDDNDEQSL